MAGVNVTVDDGKSQLAYDRASSEFNGFKKDNFIFEITTHDGDQDIAEFTIVKDGQVIRRQPSKPFPTGALKKKDQDLNDVSCIVKLKKKQPVNLNDIFTGP